MLGAKTSDSYPISEETADPGMDMKIEQPERHGSVLSGYTVITKSMIGAGM